MKNECAPSTSHEKLHSRALKVSRRYHICVSELLEILQQLDLGKTYQVYECTSLYQYAVEWLGLSEDVAVSFITVARKSVEVPALGQEIKKGALTVPKARKLC